MIKKVKRRFIILSMVIEGIILALFFLVFCALFFLNITDSVKSTMQDYTTAAHFINEKNSTTESVDIGNSDANKALDVIEKSKICVYLIDDSDNITKLDMGNAYMAKDILEDSVSQALDYNENFGNIFNHMLFFCKTATEQGTVIAFADSNGYYEYLKNVLQYGGFLFATTLVVLFIINNILAAIFIRPLKKNWDLQKNFIADASHELKTPLTVILANCKILESHSGSTVEEQIKWIKSTDEEATHMKELVDKLLFLAKNESIKTETVKNQVNISDLATSLTLQFESVAYESGVTLNSSIEKGISINSDPTAVNQIIHILIDNAVKYAGANGTVDVSLRKRNGNIFLQTKNTGEPISENDIEHIFERFYRSDKARTSGSGYGLGLSICRSLAEGIGANISVTSDSENGTVFTVKFKK